ncbi:MAG: Rrf2 family transcriptional regulator [Clostridiales bacterium]|nr:Rrf2 family transcriptional regulator [Clostridiales bacterium]
MRLSTRGRYGLRALFDLALNQSGGPIPLSEIARRQNISESYLEQLFASLRKAGLVKSVRGAHGGYNLGASADAIYIGQILRTLEGDIAPADCVNDRHATECSGADACVTRIIWEKIKDSIDQVIDSISLGDMVQKQNELDQKNLKNGIVNNSHTQCNI